VGPEPAKRNVKCDWGEKKETFEEGEQKNWNGHICKKRRYKRRDDGGEAKWGETLRKRLLIRGD